MYTDDERRIYGPYWNGQANVFGDPLRINRLLVHELGGDPNQVLADYRSDVEAAKFEATNRLVKAAGIAFGLLPFDPATGQGTTEGEAIAVVAGYLDWCGKKKESGASTPIGLPVSAGPPPVPETPAPPPVLPSRVGLPSG